MEARRDQIRDSFMDHVFKPTWKSNSSLKSEPRMIFYPRRIALDFDPNIAQFFQDLRDRGDISRATILAEVDILESDEATKRQREADQFDHIFTPVNVPHGTKIDGKIGGGNSNGGGRNPSSNLPNPQGQNKPDSKKGNS